jgi:hypothetical protein
MDVVVMLILSDISKTGPSGVKLCSFLEHADGARRSKNVADRTNLHSSIVSYQIFVEAHCGTMKLVSISINDSNTRSIQLSAYHITHDWDSIFEDVVLEKMGTVDNMSLGTGFGNIIIVRLKNRPGVF